MKRRRLIYIGAGSIAAVTTGGLWTRKAIAEQQFTKQLMIEATGEVVPMQTAVLTELPQRVSEEFRIWIHGKCINSKPFVDEVCSHGFLESLRMAGKHQEGKIINQFKVLISPSTLNAKLETIYREAVAEINTEWKLTCDRIAVKWGQALDNARPEFSAASLQEQSEQRIDELFRETVKLVQTEGSPPLGQALDEIAENAHRLIEYADVEVSILKGELKANRLVIPAFFSNSLRSLYDFIMGRINQNESSIRLQAALTDRLSVFGNRVAGDFQQEFEHIVGQFHSWQRDATETTAKALAKKEVSWI
ncbi:MAG: hypothetical protein ACI8UO_006460 [Verrucomicrobiales bacterium]|jgi:hypothetical protein